MRTICLLATLIVFLSCRTSEQHEQGVAPAVAGTVQSQNLAKATFAGGCFWCMEPAFEKLPGVVAVTSGYIGGHKPNPTYGEVSAGGTGHAEAVQVVYDSTQISYGRLLEVFWHNIDPLAADRQFCDVGTQYRSAIFHHNEEQRRLAEASRRELVQSKKFGQPVTTEIVPAATFYTAEEYHQDYYKKNPVQYQLYRSGCGRDRRLQEIWGGEH